MRHAFGSGLANALHLQHFEPHQLGDAVALSKTHTEDDLVDMRTYLRATISDQQFALIPLHGVTLVAAEVRCAGDAAGGGASAGSAAAAVGSSTGTA